MSLTTFSFLRSAQPDAPAVYFPDVQAEPCSYSQFRDMTARTIRRLQEAGFARGDVVALELSNELLHALLLVACARIGIATVSGSPAAIQDHLPVRALFRDRAAPGAPQTDAAVPVVAVDESWYRPAGGPDLSRLDLPEPDVDDLCRIMLTSGSTGSPKGVALTYGMVQERIDSFSFVLGSEFPQYLGLLCGMRLSSSLGFNFLCYSLARGGLFCSDSIEFDKIVRAIERLGLQALFTTPFTLAELVSHCEQNARQFARIPLILVGAGLASPQLAQRVRGLLCHRLVRVYGTTETGVTATLPQDGDEIGDVGTPVAGRCVDIIGSQGEVLPDGEIGDLRIRATSGPLPFFDLSDWPNRTPRDAFFPGDVGSINKGGHLIIHGRADNVINIGGTKTTFELLEQMLLAAPGVRDCGVVCQRDQLGINRITAVLVLDPFWDQGKFLSHCEANIIRDFLPTKFVLATQIPRNRNNKIDREALAKVAG